MVVKGRVSTQRGENALMETNMGVGEGISTFAVCVGGREQEGGECQQIRGRPFAADDRSHKVRSHSAPVGAVSGREGRAAFTVGSAFAATAGY